MFVLGKSKSRQICVNIEEFEFAEITWKLSVPKNHNRSKQFVKQSQSRHSKSATTKTKSPTSPTSPTKIKNKMMANRRTMSLQHSHLPNWKENATVAVRRGTNPQTVDKRNR